MKFCGGSIIGGSGSFDRIFFIILSSFVRRGPETGKSFPNHLQHVAAHIALQASGKVSEQTRNILQLTEFGSDRESTILYCAVWIVIMIWFSFYQKLNPESLSI